MNGEIRITEEQIKQTSKIAEFARNMVKQSNYPKDLQDHIIATEATKELETQIKCCAKCSHCNTYITSCIPQKRFVKLEEVCEDFELRR